MNDMYARRRLLGPATALTLPATGRTAGDDPGEGGRSPDTSAAISRLG